MIIAEMVDAHVPRKILGFQIEREDIDRIVQRPFAICVPISARDETYPVPAHPHREPAHRQVDELASDWSTEPSGAGRTPPESAETANIRPAITICDVSPGDPVQGTGPGA